jgi:CrcB protein
MTPVSWRAVLLVALGGALGSAARYLTGLWLPPASTGVMAGLPVGTLTVNVGGAFLIGALLGVLPPNAASDGSLPWLRLLLATGFCGGFTTFSALSAETLALLNTGRTARAGVYVMLTLVLGLSATGIGLRTGTALADRLLRFTSFP